MSEVLRGIVKWFDKKKGYGFIEPDDKQGDVFVHFSNIPGDGFKTLHEGQVVEFEESDNDKGVEAKNLKILSSPPQPKSNKSHKKSKGERSTPTDPNERALTVKINVAQFKTVSKLHNIPFKKLVEDMFQTAATEFLAEYDNEQAC